ncbi:MAG: CheY-like chemotaxis protein [Bacteriovoracaceae bacterium]
MDTAGKKNIIVVEDDLELMDLYKDIFGELDSEIFNVVYATSGTEAFRKFSNQKFDVLVTDYKMAKGDGLTLVDKIYHDREMELPYVVLVSAFVTKNVLTKMRKITGNKLKVHLKPASSKELIENVLDIVA